MSVGTGANGQSQGDLCFKSGWSAGLYWGFLSSVDWLWSLWSSNGCFGGDLRGPWGNMVSNWPRLPQAKRGFDRQSSSAQGTRRNRSWLIGCVTTNLYRRVWPLSRRGWKDRSGFSVIENYFSVLFLCDIFYVFIYLIHCMRSELNVRNSHTHITNVLKPVTLLLRRKLTNGMIRFSRNMMDRSSVTWLSADSISGTDLKSWFVAFYFKIFDL